jgi:hypothetical protein
MDIETRNDALNVSTSVESDEAGIGIRIEIQTSAMNAMVRATTFRQSKTLSRGFNTIIAPMRLNDKDEP